MLNLNLILQFQIIFLVLIENIFSDLKNLFLKNTVQDGEILI